jgi:hypothetical protein
MPEEGERGRERGRRGNANWIELNQFGIVLD